MFSITYSHRSNRFVWFHLVPITKTGHTGIRLKPILKTPCLIR
jgi:hypothetical protein